MCSVSKPDTARIPDSVLALNRNALTSAGSWLQPTSVLQARFFKVSAQIDF